MYDTESFQMAKSSFGRLDIVVNNAGIGGEHGDLWDICVDINLVWMTSVS